MNELPPLPPALRARILEDARREPSPTLAVRRSRVFVAAGLAAAASLALSYRLGLPARPSGVLTGIALGGGLSAVVAMWIAGSRGTSMLGRSRGALLAVAVLAPLALFAWSTIMAGVDGGVVVAGGTLAQHAACIALTLVFALGPFLAFAYVRRGSDPVHPRALGAALGASAGAWGGAMIDMHCAVTTVEHFAVGHVFPIVLVAVLGALLGAQVFGVRARR